MRIPVNLGSAIHKGVLCLSSDFIPHPEASLNKELSIEEALDVMEDGLGPNLRVADELYPLSFQTKV